MLDWPTRIKLGLLVAACIFFAGSVWLERPWLNWIAIGLLAVGLLLRFTHPGAPRHRPPDDEK